MAVTCCFGVTLCLPLPYKTENMKKTIISALLAVLCTGAFADNFTIKGRLTDVTNDTLLIEYVCHIPERKITEARVPVDGSGSFTYSCDIDCAVQASLTVQSNGNKSFFFFVPNESVEVKGASDFEAGWSLNGTAFYQKLDTVRLMELPFLTESKAASDKYRNGIAQGQDESQLKAAKDSTQRDINNRKREALRPYIMQHLDDEVTATMLFSLDYKEVPQVINRLSPDVRNGRFKDYLDGIEGFLSRVLKEIAAAKQAEREIEEGKRASDFTLKDINGNDFNLASLFGKGKYIVVDFWGSWCSWCIKGFPKMKEYYNKYRDRLEIVGVACYDKEDKWKVSVAKNNVPWLHVFSPDGITEERYGVTGYPYKVLISPKGKVIKCFKGETDEFYETLDKELD